jgi:nucleoside-triphosphatase
MTTSATPLGRNLFMTGRPGVGKTTLIERVLELLDVTAGGFCTREIREDDARVGFEIADLSGRTGVLAHIDLESGFRAGRYGVNRSDLERIGVPAIRDAVERADLIVMDEIGRMELCSPAFQHEVERALDSGTPVLGTLQDRTSPFLDRVRGRPDVTIVRITEDNRDAMVGVVREAVERLLTSGAGE